jgi:hypothetical protein
MHLLVHTIMPDDPEKNVTRLWELVKAGFKKQKTKAVFVQLKMTMFSPKGTVKLRGTAAVIKAFGKVLYAIWIQLWNASLVLHQRVELALRTGCLLEEILDRNKSEYVLPGLARIVSLLTLCFFVLVF